MSPPTFELSPSKAVLSRPYRRDHLHFSFLPPLFPNLTDVCALPFEGRGSLWRLQPNMSIKRAQTASIETLSIEAALDALLDKILEQFRQIDLFSSSNQPVIFLVYTHDNPDAGTAHAWCVIQISKWLEAAGCRAISDRNPLLPYHTQRGDRAAIRNIFSNQLCLLPQGIGNRQPANERTRAHQVLVFCSEVLRHYCVNTSARQYLETIENVYKKCRGRPRDYLDYQLHLTVEDKARNGKTWFHHVLTEIALLKLRKALDDQEHGIIPVALDDKLPDYLPCIGSTDLVLKRGNKSLFSSELHKLFFKILLQIYPHQHLAIEKFKDCYKAAKARWTWRDEAIDRSSFDAEITGRLGEVHKSILQQDQIATRQKLGNRDPRQEFQLDGGSTPIDEMDRELSLLSILATVPYRDRKDRNPERDEGTCEWFKGHSKFQEWQESEKASLLWVSADPGCGKSVLAKHLIDEVLPITEEQMTCYFFFKDDLADQKTIESALRCLLHQVFQHNMDLLDRKLLSRIEGDRQLLKSRTDLWKILIDSSRKQPVGRFVFILDGFDECSTDDRSFFMKNVQKLYMEEADPPVKLLLTSRPYEDIARGLRKLQNKELIIHLKGESEHEMDKISREISIVIEKNINDLGEELDLEPDVIGLIKTELTKIENRTYLWVSLMIDILRNAIQTSKGAIQTLIRRLPRTASAAYEKILRREQNDETNAKTRRLLHIILAAKEPLTPGQIAVAFSMGEDTLFDEKSISRDTKFIRDFSRLLIVIRDEKTYLAHQTVKEFLIMKSLELPENGLLGPCIKWERSFHPQHSSRVLAESCLSYLERQASGNDETPGGDDKSGGDVFLEYAAINWSEHLRESGDADEMMVIRSRNLCDPSSKQFSPWFLIYWTAFWWSGEGRELEPPKNPTGLIVASLLGLKETVELLLNDTIVNLSAKDIWSYGSAFFWACLQGFPSVGKSLLDFISKSNGDVFGEVLNCVDRYDNTPLHNAIINHKQLSRQLTGASDLDSIGTASDTHHEVFNLLLSRGADTNLQNTEGKTPLHIAANCSEALVKRLLQSGANIGLKDETGHTALHYAVSSGNLAVAKALLEHAVETEVDNDINSQNFKNMTPLLYAIEGEYQQIVELLLKHNADVNLVCTVERAENRLFSIEAPLNCAKNNGLTEIAELLLKYGAIDFTTRDGKMLLSRNMTSSNRDMVEFLLNPEADANATP